MMILALARCSAVFTWATASLLLASIVLVGGARVASAAAITNGSFETGDFSGWITTDLALPFFPLSVQPSGAANTFGWPWSSTPTDGRFTAFSGFDGAGPGVISIAQDIGVPSAASAILTFDYRAAWDLVFACSGCSDRLFDLVVMPSGGGAPLGSFRILTAAAGTSVPDTGELSGVVNLSAFIGQDIRIDFAMTIPNSFSGPAQLQLDNVRFAAPEPGSVALITLAITGLAFARRRKLH